MKPEFRKIIIKEQGLEGQLKDDSDDDEDNNG